MQIIDLTLQGAPRALWKNWGERWKRLGLHRETNRVILDPCGLPETEPGVRVGSFPGVPPLLREEGKVKWGKDNV